MQRVLLTIAATPLLALAQDPQSLPPSPAPVAASANTSERTTSPITYAELVSRAIRSKIVFPNKIPPLENPRAEVEVRTIPNGRIINVKVLKSSTMKSWDDAVVRAIWQANAIPLDIDGRVPQTLVLVLSPH